MLDILYDMLDWLLDLVGSFKKYIIWFAGIVALLLVVSFAFLNLWGGNSDEALSDSIDDSLPRICISLGVLKRQVSDALANGKPVSEECSSLCGLSYVEGYVVDDSEGNEDVVLVGLRCDSRPSLRLDDLVLTMRSMTKPTYPYCSLDPLPENIKRCEELSGEYSKNSGISTEEYLEKLNKAVGPQKVVVGGVPFDSRLAHVMIDADYHMKKVSQGHIMLPGIESCLDIATRNEQRGSSRSRFWFHMAKGSPTYDEDIGIMWLDECQVIILTEKQGLTPTGELVDVEEDDPVADEFARQFSSKFPVVAQFVPAYADLENLYRLRALLLAMHLRDVLSVIDSDFSRYLSGYKYLDESKMRPSYEGLTNFRQHEVTIPSGVKIVSNFVSGGVSQEMALSPESISYDNETLLQEIAQKAESLRPDNRTLWWYMN